MSRVSLLMGDDDPYERFLIEQTFREVGWVTVRVCVVGFCSEIAFGAHHFFLEESGMSPRTLSIISSHDV
jgi:hypothetical protein